MRVREPIRVAVVFGPDGTIRPVWFDWHNRKHAVLETTIIWNDLKGNARRLHFAVRDEGGLYELIYNTGDQTWSLEGLETPS
jgi:hypothetical protein